MNGIRMGKHSKDKCYECGSQDEVVFVSWYIKKDGTKGADLCRKHDFKEQSRYLKESKNG